MEKLALIYWSGSGNTEEMAKAIQIGIEESGKSVAVFQASDFAADSIDQFDGVLLGCSAMGAEELEESEFLPMFESIESQLKGRHIALFGSYGWGDGEWMRLWEDRVKKGEAVLFGEGLIVHERPDQAALEKCQTFGREFAQL